MFSQLARGSTRALVSGIFKRLRTFVGVIDVLNGFPKIGTVSFLCRVLCQHQLKLYFVSSRIDKGVAWALVLQTAPELPNHYSIGHV